MTSPPSRSTSSSRHNAVTPLAGVLNDLLGVLEVAATDLSETGD